MVTTLTAVPYPSTQTVRTNLAANPSVETNLTGWASGLATAGYATLARLGPYTNHVVPPDAPSQWLLRFQSVTSFGSVGGGVFYTVPAVNPLQPVSVSVYVRPSKSQRLRVAVEWYNGAALLATSYGPETVVPGAWTRMSVPGLTSPASTTRAVVYVSAVAGAGASIWLPGDSLDVDALLVEGVATVGTYFDGSYSNAGLIGERYAWAGTAHASQSTYTVRTPTGAAESITPELVLGMEVQRESSAVVHQIIDRPDPVVTSGPLRTRTGSLEVWCASEADAHALVQLHEARVVLLRDDEAPTRDMYYVHSRVSAAPAEGKVRWIVTIDYVEVYGTATLW